MDILQEHLEDENSSLMSKDEPAGIVIEESEIADCDDEDDDGDPSGEDPLPYSEALAYRVVHVNSSPGTAEIEIPTNSTGNGTLQVLTSPINGQFYVIGSANDVFTTAQTTRAVIAPRATTTLQMDTPRNNSNSIKKRDDRRRATHNEVERRRRDKINNWIAKLGKIIPECSGSSSSISNGENGGKSNYETQSKGGILAKACEYITELREANQSLGQCMKDNEKLRQEVHSLKQIIIALKRENTQLKGQVCHSLEESILS